MLRNNFLFKQTENVVQRFTQMGIMQHILEYHIWICNRPIITIEENDPKVLTMDDLEFGFIIWLTVIFVSILGFLFEYTKFGLNVLFGMFAAKSLFLKIKHSTI